MQQNLLLQFIQTSRQLDKVLTSMAEKELGMDVSTWFALLLLLEEPRAQNYLATNLSLTPAAITNVIDKLEKQKLVERVSNPSDRRQKVIQLTKIGRALAQSSQAMLGGISAHLLAGVNVTELAANLQSLSGNVESLTD